MSDQYFGTDRVEPHGEEYDTGSESEDSGLQPRPGEDGPKNASRRKLLAAASAEAAAAAGAAFAAYKLFSPGWATKVRVVYVDASIPSTDPNAHIWARAVPARIQMGPQTQALPTKPKAEIAALFARALHNGEKIAFLLEWKSKGESVSTLRTEDFRDACGVLL